MTSETTFNPVADIFDNDGAADWHFTSTELCRRENISPNMLAFCRARATLALVIKRSITGTDFALSEAGLLYLETVLNKGTLKDGTPVRAAYVVLAEVDRRSPLRLKIVSFSSAQETRARLYGLQPYPGKSGDYWWIQSNTVPDKDAPF